MIRRIHTSYCGPISIDHVTRLYRDEETCAVMAELSTGTKVMVAPTETVPQAIAIIRGIERLIDKGERQIEVATLEEEARSSS